MKTMKLEQIVDLRSDTVTRPGPEMRKAMAEAEVGDDVFGEDPTVNRLQELAAGLAGKESALFMASGSMSNQAAIKAHTRHGQSIIVGEGAHSYLLEAGAVSAISGVVPVIAGAGGTFTKDDFLCQVMPGNVHYPPTSLVMVENTHNRGGGIIFPLKDIEEICAEARRRGIKSHLDGARVFNAAIAQGASVRKICEPFDSVSFCLSKGLGAPVGSLLSGSREFIVSAHRYRKMFGGGMRQAGILAAAGIWALEHNVERLSDDHARARRLAEALSDLPGIELQLSRVQTNIIIFNVSRPGLSAGALVDKLKAEGVLALTTGPDSVRLVTHLDVDDKGIEHAVKSFRMVMG